MSTVGVARLRPVDHRPSRRRAGRPGSRSGCARRCRRASSPTRRATPRAWAASRPEKTGESRWCTGSAMSTPLPTSRSTSSSVGGRMLKPSGHAPAPVRRAPGCRATAGGRTTAGTRRRSRRRRSPARARTGACGPPRPSARPRAAYASRMSSGSRAAWPALSTQTFGPHVLSSNGIAEHVRDDLAVPRRRRPRTRRSERHERLDLGARGRAGSSNRASSAGSRRAVPAVALGEQLGGGVQIVVGERSRRGRRHGRGR